MSALTSTPRVLVTVLGLLNLCACATTNAPGQAAPDNARAGIAAVSPGTVYDFECDVPPGHYSIWSRSVSAKGVAISGTLHFKELRSDRNWVPTATIGIALGRNIGGAVRVEQSSPTDHMLTVVLLDVGASAPKRIVGYLPLDAGLIHFSVQLTPDSVLRFSIAGINGFERFSRTNPVRVQLGCSTADVHFSNVTASMSNGAP